MWPEVVSAAHVTLLNSYTRSGMLTLEAVPDDGYILQVCVFCVCFVCGVC